MEKEQTMQQMEADAALAKADLDPKMLNASPDAVKGVANWMKKWYLKAGYKRLSRILIELAD
jgi:hypothetical protein